MNDSKIQSAVCKQTESGDFYVLSKRSKRDMQRIRRTLKRTDPKRTYRLFLTSKKIGELV